MRLLFALMVWSIALSIGTGGALAGGSSDSTGEEFQGEPTCLEHCYETHEECTAYCKSEETQDLRDYCEANCYRELGDCWMGCQDVRKEVK